VNRGADERINPRFAIIVEREDVHVVAAGEPLDEPHERRHDVAPRGVDASGHHQAYAHMNMIRTLAAVALCAAAATIEIGAARSTLDIYFIDVEGGQSTLFVTPAGQSLLVDAGFPGERGGFDALPGDPARARDANRIVAAARDAGVARIDYLLTTHFHADHDGGVVELSQLMPIRTFVDHGSVLPAAEETSPGTLAAFERYAAVAAKGRHLEPAPGARLPLKGVEVTIVSAAGATITRPLAGSGRATPACDAPVRSPDEPHENPRSTGFQLRYGRFTVLDVGDLTGAPLRALACPNALVGPVDLYVVAHHGGGDAADPPTLAAFRPRVAVVNNGARKGGMPVTLAAVRAAGADLWQLHRSDQPGAENAADDHLANLDAAAAYWIKATARSDGSFTVSNARTGSTRRYGATAAK
jgi:beta-lactamase superfamily II metal-dependent hydrolase